MKFILILLSTAFIFGLTWNVSINYNIVVFGPMFFLILLYMDNPFPLKKKYTNITIAFIAIFVFWSLINITVPNNYSIYESDRFIKVFLFGLIILVFTFLFYGKRKELLLKSIDYALWIMVLLWWMQLISFYITGEYIDLLQLVGSVREQRYQAYWIQSGLPIDIIRPTSIFIEPGTYAVNTFPLLVLSYLVHNKITKLHTILLISYFGTLSLFAIIISTLFIFISQISTFEFKLTMKNLFLLVLFLLIILGVEQYLTFRFVEEGGTDQVGYRETIIAYWLSLDSKGIILGTGAAQTIFKKSMIEDASFIFKLFFDYGILAMPYILLVGYISRGLPLLFFFIILLSKVHYQIYIMWFYIAALAILWDNEKKMRSYP